MSSIERALHNEVARERAAAQALADDPAPVALAALGTAAIRYAAAVARAAAMTDDLAVDDHDPAYLAALTAEEDSGRAVLTAARAYAREVAA